MFKSLLPTSYHRYLEFLPLFFLSTAIALVLTPFVGYIARKLKILGYPPSMRDGDKPSDYRHLEKPPTPLLGGVAVLLPLIILSLIHTTLSPITTYFLAGIGVILVGGILDDKFELSYRTQILFQIIAAVMIFISPLNLEFINNPFNGLFDLNWWQGTTNLGNLIIDIVLPGDLILLGWIMVCINAVKWVGGTDGLMEGDSLFASLALFIISLRIKNYTSATISIIFGGLILGFLVYNFYPARIRSGSSGKTAYGFILAVLSVMSGAKIATGIIVLMIPLIDFVWVIIGRIKKHRPRSISSLMQISDKSHLHHRLLRLGLNEPQIAFFEYLLSAILGTIALAVSGAMNAFIWLSTTLGIIIVLLVISRLLHKRTEDPPPDSEKSPESKYSY